MDQFELVFLALIQGLTEFLPISSSAHLILPSKLLGWRDQGLTYDVAVHLGTLLAVMFYYRARLLLMGRSLLTVRWHLLSTSAGPVAGVAEESGHLALLKQVCLASVPILLIGAIGHHWIETYLRSLWVIATTTLVFGILLGLSYVYGTKTQTIAQMTYRMALVIGIAQVLALIPGVSRSGITMSMALVLGLQPVAAAHFSFLMSIPAIFAASFMQACQLLGNLEQFWLPDLLVAALISGLSAYLTIAFFVRLLEKIGMMPFVIYRVLLGFLIFFLLVWFGY